MKQKPNPFLRSLHPVSVALSFLLTVAGLSRQSALADATWTGTSSQDWNNAANWSVSPAGLLTINTGTGSYPIISSNSTFTPGSIHMARVSSGTTTARLEINASVTTTNEVVVNDSQNASTAGQGTLNVNNGGTLNSGGDLLISFAGSSSAFGQLTVATGGTVNVATTAKRWLIVNQWDTAQGRLNVDGGTLNLNTNTDIRFSTGNGTGTSSVTLGNGGAITAWSGNQTGAGSTSVIDMNNNGGTVNNTFHLNGGTLTIGQIISTKTTGTRVFNFNGGTLKPTFSTAAFMNSGVASSANVKAGGAKIDTNGFDVTIGQVLVHDSALGATADGGLTKSGVGTLVLSGANTYTGGTTISSGTLQLTTTAGAANSGTFNLGGGTFQVNLGAGNNFGYAPAIVLTANSAFGNAAAGSLANLNGQINYTGTITGNGNALNIANTGVARLYMNGTLNNVSQINVQSGAMGFDLNSTNNRGTAPVAVSSGAALWFAGVNTSPIANNLTFNGGNGINSGGALYYEGGAVAPAALTGGITLAGGNTGIGTAFAADTITLNGNITGPGALTQIKGNIVLSGASDYSGGTTIASGAMTANSSSALGTGAVGISAVSGAQLRLGSGVNVGNALTISGGGVVAQGVLHAATGDATYSGAITITGVQNAGGHFAAGTGTLNLTGSITSSVPVTIRDGTVVLSNTGSSYSALAVQQGTTRLGANHAVPVAASVDLGLSGAATLDLAGYNQTLAGLTKNANAATVTNSGASASTLTLTGTSNFAGVIQDGATHQTALTVNGGSLTLSGNNTYTGATTVSAGTLLVTGTLGNSTTTIGSGAVLGGSGTITGAATIAAGGTLSAGNSPGLLTFGSTLNLEGATLFEIGSQVRGSGYDGINVGGLLTYGGALNITAYDLGGGLYDLAQAAAYDLFALSGGATGDFASVTVGGNALAFSSGVWTGTDSLNSNVTYTFTQSTGDLAVTVIPEPGAALLGGLGLLCILRRRR